MRSVGPVVSAAAVRKQARVPRGATVLEPVGTAPGLVVPPADGRDGPIVLVLPGPPAELQGMWPAAVETGELSTLDNVRKASEIAMHAGAAPLQASSGKTVRHRLNPGGDRQANAALYRIVLCRLRWDPGLRCVSIRPTGRASL